MKMDLITNQNVEQFLKGMCAGIEMDSPLFDMAILVSISTVEVRLNVG